MQCRLFEPEVELMIAAVAWARRGLRLTFRTAWRTSDLDMKMFGVAIPGTDLEKPGAVSSRLAAPRLLDRGVYSNSGDGPVLSSGANELGMLVGPHFRIDVEHIRRDNIGGRAELALLATLHVVWHRREPNIGVQADLMASVLGEHRSAARLRHVANQKAVPADLFCVLIKPFLEANEVRVAPPSRPLPGH